MFTHRADTLVIFPLGIELSVPGKDGSREYLTSQFEDEGLPDDIKCTTVQQITEVLNHWINIFAKIFPFVGRLNVRI